MPEYFAIVTQLGRGIMPIQNKCGQLRAKSEQKAHDEAKQYEMAINSYIDRDEALMRLKEDFIMVISVPYHEARDIKGFNQWSMRYIDEIDSKPIDDLADIKLEISTLSIEQRKLLAMWLSVNVDS